MKFGGVGSHLHARCSAHIKAGRSPVVDHRDGRSSRRLRGGGVCSFKVLSGSGEGCSFKMLSARAQPQRAGVVVVVVVGCPQPCGEPGVAEHGLPAQPVQLRQLPACAPRLQAPDWINAHPSTTGCEFWWPGAGWRASLRVSATGGGRSESHLEATRIPGCGQGLSQPWALVDDV